MSMVAVNRKRPFPVNRSLAFKLELDTVMYFMPLDSEFGGRKYRVAMDFTGQERNLLPSTDEDAFRSRYMVDANSSFYEMVTTNQSATAPQPLLLEFGPSSYIYVVGRPATQGDLRRAYFQAFSCKLSELR
jgi:hypothetical protein